MENGTAWIPLANYSVQYRVSLSTLRRQIKSGTLDYRIEKGKYLLKEVPPPEQGIKSAYLPMLKLRLAKTEAELKKAREEIGELKMLVALYEERLNYASR